MSGGGTLLSGGLLLGRSRSVVTSAAAAPKLPGDRELADADIMEVLEKTFTHIQGTISASRTLIHDRSRS